MKYSFNIQFNYHLIQCLISVSFWCNLLVFPWNCMKPMAPSIDWAVCLSLSQFESAELSSHPPPPKILKYPLRNHLYMLFTSISYLYLHTLVRGLVQWIQQKCDQGEMFFSKILGGLQIPFCPQNAHPMQCTVTHQRLIQHLPPLYWLLDWYQSISAAAVVSYSILWWSCLCCFLSLLIYPVLIILVCYSGCIYKVSGMPSTDEQCAVSWRMSV